MKKEQNEKERYAICADIDHGGHPTDRAIYTAHMPRRDEFNTEGWLLFFTGKEVGSLTRLVQGIIAREKIVLPMIQIDALSVRAISIYTYGDQRLLQKLRQASQITVNRADPF